MTLPTLEMASCPVPGARAAPFTSHSVAQARPVRPKSSAVTQQQVLSAPRTQQQPQLQPQPALCGHPDAQRRREQAQRRKATAALDAQLARSPDWWDTLTPHNVQNCSNAAELRQAVTSLSQPVVVSFFAAWCAGCRRLHPKLMQIAGQNPHITFLKVNAGVEHMRGVCEMMGVLTLPYFIVYNSGEVVDRFSLNLTRVDKLRSAVAGLAPACDKVAKLQVLLP